MIAIIQTLRACIVLVGSLGAGVMAVYGVGSIFGSPSVSHAQEMSRYCSASAVASAQNELPQPIVQAIAQRCKVGDTIMVDASQIMVIGRACDFTKSMVSTGRAVVCVFAGDRGSR